MIQDRAKQSGRTRRRREGMGISEAYALLGLSPLADRELVHATYRRLVLRYHPDKDNGNLERFKELASAYHILEAKFRIEQEETDGARGECDRCGTYDRLIESPDGSRCCPGCLPLAGRRRLLPAPPVVIVSCATTVVLLCLAAGCLLAGWASWTKTYSAAATILGIASLVSLGVTCLTVIYTAEPRVVPRKTAPRRRR